MENKCVVCSSMQRAVPLKTVCGDHWCLECFKNCFRDNVLFECPGCKKNLKFSNFSHKNAKKSVDALVNYSSYKYFIYRLDQRHRDYVSDSIVNQGLKDDDISPYIIPNFPISYTETDENFKFLDDIDETGDSDPLHNQETPLKSLKNSTESAEIKEMPDCMNLESVKAIQDYDITSMEPSLKSLILSASGYDHNEIHKTALKELLEGLI